MLKFTANLSLLFTEVELTNRFKAAKQKGFDAVEIQFPYNLSAETLKNTLEEEQLKLVFLMWTLMICYLAAKGSPVWLKNRIISARRSRKRLNTLSY